jgi:hypothetical protein
MLSTDVEELIDHPVVVGHVDGRDVSAISPNLEPSETTPRSRRNWRT